MIEWHVVNKAEYLAAEDALKTDNKIYFIADTGEIYRGNKSFSESVVLYDELPAESISINKLYIDRATLEGKIWNGTAWVSVIKPVAATINGTDTSTPVSGKAVKDYVNNAIGTSGNIVADVAYTAADNKLTVTMNDATTKDVPLTNVATDLVYDTATGKLQVKNAAGTAIGTGINLDLERFVSEATYDANTKKIILKFNDSSDPLSIDVGDLVDTYTAKNSTTVSLTVTGNEFTAEAIVASDDTHSDNILKKTDNGLYVAAIDISGKLDKVADTNVGDVVTFAANGAIADSGVKVGGATLAAEPSVATLATEAAVAAIRTALTASVNTKMDKVGADHKDEVIIASETGNAVASGVKVGSATFAETGGESLLATEAGVIDYVTNNAISKAAIVKAGQVPADLSTASDGKVISEKCFLDALTWKTTV